MFVTVSALCSALASKMKELFSAIALPLCHPAAALLHLQGDAEVMQQEIVVPFWKSAELTREVKVKPKQTFSSRAHVKKPRMGLPSGSAVLVALWMTAVIHELAVTLGGGTVCATLQTSL